MRDKTPAFPVTPEQFGQGFSGISTRDYFAAAALTGFIANEALIQTAINQAIESKTTPEAVIAERCYKFADVMIFAKEK